MVKEFITDRLEIKRPTKDEQYDLWNILKDEKVICLHLKDLRLEKNFKSL